MHFFRNGYLVLHARCVSTVWGQRLSGVLSEYRAGVKERGMMHEEYHGFKWRPATRISIFRKSKSVTHAVLPDTLASLCANSHLRALAIFC